MSENIPTRTPAGPSRTAMTALTITALFIFVPLIGELLVFFLPAPIAYMRFRHGRAQAAVTAVACIALSAAGGLSFLVPVVAGLVAGGYLTGAFLKTAYRPDAAIAASSAVVSATVAASAGVWFASNGKDPVAVVASVVAESMKQSVAMYRQVGMSEADIQSMMPVIDLYAGLIKHYFPAILVYAFAISAFACYGITKRRLASEGAQEVAGIVPLSGWTPPDALVWFIIVPGFLMVPDVPELRIVAGNVLAVAAVAYLAQGLGLVRFFFDKLNLSRLMRGLGYALVLLQPYLIMGVWVLGLFDTWADFRKLRKGIVKK